MKRFEYEITQHAANTFKQLVYFCSETGECSIDEVPGDQIRMLVDILNGQGREGWELVQVSFGKDGVLAFWKRKIKDKEK